MKHQPVIILAVILLLLPISHVSICDPVEELYEQIKKIQSADSILTYQPRYSDQATDSELAKYYFLVAWKYQQVEDYAKAFDYYSQSLSLYRDSDDLIKAEKCLDNLGGLAIRLRKYKKAYAYYNQAWQTNKILGDRREIALSLRDIGTTLAQTLDGKKEGLWYLTQAADLFEQIPDYYLLSGVYLQMGVIHKKLEAYNSAMDCYNLALKHAPASEKILAKVLNNQSNLLQVQGNYEAALVLQDSALVIKRALGDAQLLITSLNTLGAIQYALGHHDQAFDALIEAYQTNTAQIERSQSSYDNLRESYLYLDSVSMATNDPAKLYQYGIQRSFIAEQNKLLAAQKAYLIRDKLYQENQIIEKERLADSKALKEQILWGLGLGILLSLVIVRQSLTQKKKIAQKFNSFKESYNRKCDRARALLRRMGEDI